MVSLMESWITGRLWQLEHDFSRHKYLVHFLDSFNLQQFRIINVCPLKLRIGTTFPKTQSMERNHEHGFGSVSKKEGRDDSARSLYDNRGNSGKQHKNIIMVQFQQLLDIYVLRFYFTTYLSSLVYISLKLNYWDYMAYQHGAFLKKKIIQKTYFAKQQNRNGSTLIFALVT